MTMKKRPTTSNVIRAQIAGEFRREALGSLMIGDPVRLPDGQAAEYASSSTRYWGGKNAEISVTCYHLPAGGADNAAGLPGTFYSHTLKRNIPVGITFAERPGAKRRISRYE